MYISPSLASPTNKCDQIWAQGSPDWSKMGQIRDFFRSYFSTFWLTEPKCTEIWSEKITDLSNLGPIWPTLWPNLIILSWAEGRCDWNYPLAQSDVSCIHMMAANGVGVVPVWCRSQSPDNLPFARSSLSIMQIHHTSLSSALGAGPDWAVETGTLAFLSRGL